MELNSKKLEKTSKVIYIAISVILCVFLILLANNIIADLDSTTEQPVVDNFKNKAQSNQLATQRDSILYQLEIFEGKKSTIQKTIETAQHNYANEKQSFDNWLQTRKTLGSPNKDQEVIERANKLDAYYKIEQNWRAQLDAQSATIDLLNKRLEKNDLHVSKLDQAAYQKYENAYATYELKVFLIRLLFVGPILAIGIFFFIRYRKHQFWPIFLGFSLFSVYCFFFGLVPYLPSYGGYVRYAVGILLSIGLGYYAIKTIRKYLELKQAELKISTTERAKNVQTSVAEKALENHFCPSCGKDFMLKKWEFPMGNQLQEAYQFVTDFCRHCGLGLFANCHQCGHKNFAHLPHCGNCGSKPIQKEAVSKQNTQELSDI